MLVRLTSSSLRKTKTETFTITINLQSQKYKQNWYKCSIDIAYGNQKDQAFKFTVSSDNFFEISRTSSDNEFNNYFGDKFRLANTCDVEVSFEQEQNMDKNDVCTLSRKESMQ